MEDLVVSLETAKQLKHNGFPQETYSFWEKWVGNVEGYSIHHYSNVDNAHPNDKSRLFAAPTAEEVLRALPTRPKDNSHMELVIWKGSKRTGWNIEYRMMYHDCGRKDSLGYQNNDSLSEAAAQLYLYLKKEGLL